jgi:hypothetical protein
MTARLLLVTLLACLLASPARAQLGLPEIAARMRAAAGAAADPSAGDLEIRGQVQVEDGKRFGLSVRIRRTPFAYREELSWRGASAPPPGIARTAVFVSDGVRCWNLADEAGPTGPMTGWPAVQLLDNVNLFRLLIEPRAMLESGLDRPARVVTADQARPGVDEEALFGVFRHGTAWVARVDRTSGRLTVLTDSTGVTQRWYLLHDWRPLGDGLTLPARIETGVERTTGPILLLESAHAGLHHAADRFPGDPLPPLGEVEEVARLIVVQHPTPGAASVVLPQGRVQRAGGSISDVWTVFDTGASGLNLAPELAASLDLPRLGLQSSTGALGGGLSDWLFVDRFDLGSRAWLQLPAAVSPLPPQNELPSEHPMGVVFGGARLLETSPVLDLRGGRLLLRGRAAADGVRTLASITGRTSLTLPLRDDGHGKPLLDVTLGGPSITALLDTGLPATLRLAASDQRRLGLPDDASYWLERGAVPYRVSGIHGHARDELQVRLEQDLVLGPVTLRRPLVTLMSAALDAPDSKAVQESQVGMGALSAFDLVGFDWNRMLLELVPPAAILQTGEPARASVPPVGDFLGFALGAPERGPTERPRSLPLVLRVSEGSAAARAGLHEGDRLAEVDGTPCDGVAPMELWGRLRAGGGTVVRLRVLRGGELVAVTLGA